MIIVCYPVGTGGNFIGSLLALILKGIEPVVQPNGSMHNNTGYKVCNSIEDIKICDHYDIVIMHESNIKQVVDLYSSAKIICISITQSNYGIQEKNFLKKCIPDFWSERWYNCYKSELYPPYSANLSNMPQWVIQDILKINQQYIKNWQYVFPADMSNIVQIDFDEILHGNTLINKIKLFLGVDNVDQSVYNLINNYRELQRSL